MSARRWFVIVGLSLCWAVAGAQEKILLLGDSLSAAYGIPQEQSWPVLLSQQLKTEGHEVDLVNASISGETTAGGLRRLPALLEEHQPDWLWIELGANDGLRGLPLDQMRSNLLAMIDLARSESAQVLLFEMRLPTNYGPRHTQAFRAIYAALAERPQVHLLPFFLEQIATDRAYFLEDGIHPNLSAQPLLMQHILEGWKQAQQP